MPEHPLHRFFTSQRPRPTFEWERYQQRDVLIIDHPRCQAVFSRQGAQLLHFQPAGEKPWLWCAEQWPQVGAIRGGVPVCWPWYGRHPSEDLWPAHGWARLLDWKLVDSREDEEGVTLKWRLDLCDWQVDLHARLGASMELSLSTEHQDSEPCQLSHALLAYWRISDVSKIALSGLEDIEGYDRLNRQACREDGALTLKGGCQKVYPGTPRVQLQDPAWQRELCIDTGDSDDTVVWHPGNRPLMGVTGRECQGFVCVEAASGSDEGLSLAPGERAHLRLQAHRLS
ncbi:MULTISPECIES: D-hexose-6-phosphate mutarotase [unclassified Pseudomonas]|uniref:D-hexose-6-phosphate mutarotase n=1 Tax=unclassified Pseudomonas TaxID=196821 RepID=UPI00244CAF6A|nr:MULTISPECIES: D-hexose-6-phosphate mutarotase [unclassified Pseudomonas]MDH0304637.1 D-hexose-6-phosphate mutarotase [Pseudomonas sp. GD04091]MDH1987824.1 D-hexose-6-phosphate mutarotase [Pseudomonas sp. GD03689]